MSRSRKSQTKPARPLAELFASYVDQRALSVQSRYKYREALRAFERFLKRPPAVTDLSSPTIERFLEWMGESRSESTCKNARVALMAWWRFAAELDLILPPPMLGRDTAERAAERVQPNGVAARPLAELVTSYVDQRAVSAKTQCMHRAYLRAFELFLKRPPLVTDLSATTIERFLESRAESTSDRTCRKVRTLLLAWWRFAAELRLLLPPPMQGRDAAERAAYGCLQELAAERAAERVRSKGDAISLTAALEMYQSERLTFGKESTFNQLDINVRRLSNFLGRTATIDDLTNDVVRQAMSRMINDGLAARTANKFRDNMLALWRFLAQRGILAVWPDVQAVTEPKRVPTAWTREQLAKLFAACEAQRGFIGAIRANHFWHALHAVAWDTGERISGLLSIRWADVDLKRQWIVVRAEGRKGGTEDKASRLHPETVAALKLIESPKRDLVFDWPYDRCYLWPRYGALLESAGLPNDRQHKFHCLRKSVASYFEAAGGSATDALGHSDSRITKRHYIDPRIVTPQSAADLLFRPDAKSLANAKKRDEAQHSVKSTRDAHLAWLIEHWAVMPETVHLEVLKAAGFDDSQALQPES